MSIGNFRKISNKQIKPTNIVFKTYKGDSIIPLGYVTVRVQYKNQKVNLNVYIVKENLDTILGREWLYKIHLDWPAIKAFRAKTEQNLNNLLREYKDIFDDKLGEINNYEAKLKLRHGVKPIFCRVRTVPFALKGRVENEIDRLEKEGIIEKVDSSEWATPVVPVVKSDGSIRLCADYSVTLNPNLIVPQHPLPRLDEIFGRRFTLITDHKPLIAIFGSKRGLPVLAATRLLHYALILQSFEFDIIFRKTIEHGNADFLSRLPKTSEELEVKDDITIFQMSQIEALPVTSKELRQETSEDIELGPLLRALREGTDLQGREAQCTIEDGCIMYGQRVCIPRKFRKNVLEELHAGHLGIVKMKAIARSFVYWKNIDNDIEEAAKNC
ncbi:uncharacterized protein K02A2.6 [Trichonephila clavipes]|nr:uncharacterized protein K02A2.6 [Trichonephila clavipes]